MRKLLLGLAVLFLLPVAASAQDAPDVEVFGGYSYFREPALGIFDDSNLHGWEVSVTKNFTPYFGVEVDVSGHYGNREERSVNFIPPIDPIFIPEVNTSAFNYMIGPHVGADIGRARPFAHALIGGTTERFTIEGFASGSDTSLSAAFGGGVDFRLSKSISIRAIQADYILTTFGPQKQNNARVSAGIVFTFGR
jgi:opacity protein-like surface antigen